MCDEREKEEKDRMDERIAHRYRVIFENREPKFIVAKLLATGKC